MAKEVVFEVREAEEGGYYAAAVGYDVITQGDSWEDLKLMAQDAVCAISMTMQCPGRSGCIW